ncbi:Gfo/Idh/MocA family protein [Kineococcus sp. TBRC 1896]|uniref:Gfo/Idh/MocA family protein n=1 Tax=Kineococcus mangrovi TaxID=1660183 RepID=A0ABV4I822_9ACTN
MSTTALPPPRPIVPGPPLGWGVLAPGGIAGRFVAALHAHTAQRAVAVGSRSTDRAAAFASQHGIDRSYGSADELVSDPGVDVVYVAAPHQAHAPLALQAVAAGKHVLVEKPFATGRDEAKAVVDAARAAGVLVMEAMWTRYLPQLDVVRQLLADGAVGQVDLVTSDFGFQLPFDPSSRMYDPARAGGALLDAGIYPLSFISSVLGSPADVVARGALAPTGVEYKASVLMTYAGHDAHGIATTSTQAAYPVLATVSGSQGRIDVHSPFLAASGVTFTPGGWGRDAAPLTWRDTSHPDLYAAMHHEADALASYVGQGLLESPVHPLSEVVDVIATIDEVRRQLGAPVSPGGA